MQGNLISAVAWKCYNANAKRKICAEKMPTSVVELVVQEKVVPLACACRGVFQALQAKGPGFAYEKYDAVRLTTEHDVSPRNDFSFTPLYV